MTWSRIRSAALILVAVVLLTLSQLRTASGGEGTQGVGWQGVGWQGVGWQGVGWQGVGWQGVGWQGVGWQGVGWQGVGWQGLGLQGTNSQGTALQGVGWQGVGWQGVGWQGVGWQGVGWQGVGWQGVGWQGVGWQGVGWQGVGWQGTPLRGIDRLGVVVGDMRQGYLKLLARVDLEDGPVSWLQSQGVREPDDLSGLEGVHLQFGPESTEDPTGNLRSAESAGSFICIPNGSGGCLSAEQSKGTFWLMPLYDANQVETYSVPSTQDPEVKVFDQASVPSKETHGLMLYVADATIDPSQNQSKYPSNSDVYLYTVYYRHPATMQWVSLCPTDPYGNAHAMAVPLNPFGKRGESEWSNEFTFACAGSGVAAKCSRIWGYKPWLDTVPVDLWEPDPNNPALTQPAQSSIDLEPFFKACMMAARADYCQEGRSFTRNGTTVDLFDRLGDGQSSFVETAGFGNKPGSPGLMLHEEYQISVDKTVSQLMSSTEQSGLDPDTQALVERLQASGLQSSRYPDLDPGRSCLAAPYIDRCDPEKPGSCYRANNLPPEDYGALIAINSPRHCSHPDDQAGEALDPLCNLCVARVCDVDPTCCGDAGASYYAGSLLWDERCIALRDEVCKSSPQGETWPAGHAAEPAGGHGATIPRGPIGALLGIFHDAGDDTLYAEGWACDQDHPGASIPVQVSVGDELYAGGTLVTPSGEELGFAADQQLATHWQELVRVECMGGTRHGFRIPLGSPTEVAGQEVYAYAIDLDVPGVPATLLRGGKKKIPNLAAPDPVQPTGALWTGWLEPEETGVYEFSATPCPDDDPTTCNDRYRFWVNGWIVDADASYPGGDPRTNPATAADPAWPDGEGPLPPAPDIKQHLSLQKGVSVAIRVEHIGQDSGSGIHIQYKPPSKSAFEEIPTNRLYPLTEHSGNGLRAEYFEGVLPSNVQAQGNQSPFNAPIDHIWSRVDDAWTMVAPEVSPFIPESETLPEGEAFSVRWRGQVMAPISGIYRFGAEADGPVTIRIEGKYVTDTSENPPAVSNSAECSHDICTAGAAINPACPQGGSCAAQICVSDPFCCWNTWDARCVQQVETVCAETCNPSPPLAVFLSAGAKYDIVVDYVHEQGQNARAKLLWALLGSALQPVPPNLLFSSVDADPPGCGTGLNATWLDEELNDELLHTTIASPLKYTRNAPPTALLATGVSCDSGANCDYSMGCGGAPVPEGPSAPTLRSAKVTGADVEVLGAGAIQDGTVQIYVDGAAAGGAVTPFVSGEFTELLTGLGLGRHTLTATNWLGTEESEPSEPLTVDLAGSLPAPVVLLPSNGEPIDMPVPCMVKGSPDANLFAQTQAGVLDLGPFGTSGEIIDNDCLPLGPGVHPVEFYQKDGEGNTSAAVLVEVRVRPQPLTITEPEAGATLTQSPILVVGGNADPSLNDVYVAAGDESYFAEIGPLSNLALEGGSFSGNLELGYGRHFLKFYQKTPAPDSVAGDMQPIEVFVPPPADPLTITTPQPGPVDSIVSVAGLGALPRNGQTVLRSAVHAYLDGNEVAVGPVGDDELGSWELPAVMLSPPGSHTLKVTQFVPSLSGAGEMAAGEASVGVYVRPPAPNLTLTTLDPVELEVTGAIEGWYVTIYDNGLPGTGAMQVSASALAVSGITLERGVHALTARQAQTADPGLALEGPASNPVYVPSGDLTPPTIALDPPGQSLAVRDEVAPFLKEPVNFVVSASDDVDGAITANCAEALPPCYSCNPASGSEFALGPTRVSCEARDAAGNVGATSFVVNVIGNAPPGVAVSNVSVEAGSSAGAVVNYDVSAWGSVGDCSPPEVEQVQACSSWQPANDGLGFTPLAIAASPDTSGKVYAVVAESVLEQGRFYRSSDNGDAWTFAGLVGPNTLRILTPRNEPTTLYVVSADGVLKSSDDAASFSTCSPPLGVERLRGGSLSELNRLVVWGGIYDPVTTQQPFAYRSVDGCQSWTALPLPGLKPNESPLYLAEGQDSNGASRFFLSTHLTLQPGEQDERVGTRIYRGVGPAGSPVWQRIDTIPVEEGSTFDNPATFIHVSGDTVITSTAISWQGGAPYTWSPIHRDIAPLSAGIVRDPNDANVVYAGSARGLIASSNNGQDWVKEAYPNLAESTGVPLTELVIDGGSTFYAREPLSGISRSGEGDVWDRLELPGLSLDDGLVQDVAVDPVDPGVAYVLKYADGIFKTVSGGLAPVTVPPQEAEPAWSPFREGFDHAPEAEQDLSLWARQVAIDPFNRSHLYVGGSSLWEYIGGGYGWVPVSTTGVANLSPRLGGEFGAFRVDPYRPGTVYWAPWNQSDPKQIWQTADGGHNWSSTVPSVCSAGNLATSANLSSEAAGDVADLNDGQTEYADEAHGLQAVPGGDGTFNLDFGAEVNFSKVTVWHHPDNAIRGHNVPANVSLQYYSESTRTWQSLTGFSRSYDLNHEPTDPSNFGSIPDTYVFPQVMGSQLTWSFDGTGPNVLGQSATGPLSVATGSYHSCAILPNGRVACWGRGDLGQLGNGELNDSDVPVLVLGVRDAVSVVAGEAHTCALSSAGRVDCWGVGDAIGQVETGSVPFPEPVEVLGESVIAIAAGAGHNCALTDSGLVSCWGNNFQGQLGNSGGWSGGARVVSGVSGATAVTAGSDHSCALIGNSEVMCWGYNGDGELGDGTTTDSFAPVSVTLPTGTVYDIAAGGYHTCARMATDDDQVQGLTRVECWGWNVFGQLGNGTTVNSSFPVIVSDLDDARGLGVGYAHSCAIRETGELACWGWADAGQIGDVPTTTFSTTAVPVNNLTGVAALSGGVSHTCAVTQNGELSCWGSNADGQLGDGTGQDSDTPSSVVGLDFKNQTTLGAGEGHSCALQPMGEVACWGYNGAGNLGDGTNLNRLTPVAVSGISDALSLSVGGNHNCVVREGRDRLSCWGSGEYGELGNAANVDSSLPVDVEFSLLVGGALTTPISPTVAAGGWHTCYVEAGGAVACWGWNQYGQLGTGDTGERNTPSWTPVEDAIGIATGGLHTCVLHEDGKVSCFGQGIFGQLGQGEFTDSNTPVDVLGIPEPAVAITAGWNHSCALMGGDIAGQVMCWGGNGYGQLGDGNPDNADANTPGFVSGITNAVQIDAGFYHTCAVQATGEVSCWGWNESGQLGDGSTLDSNVPVGVPSLDDALRVTAGEDHTCVVRESGELSCWGQGLWGQLGNGANDDVLEPVAVSPLPESSSGVTPWHGWVYEIEVQGCAPEPGPEPDTPGDGLRIQVLPGSAPTLLYSSDEANVLSNSGLSSWAGLGSGSGRVVVDPSTNPPTFYVGGASLGLDPKTLYAITDPIQPATPVGSDAEQAAFQRFALDPGGTGTGAMYAIGDGFTFLVSSDQGASWYRDPGAPDSMFITNFWVSPADGAIFATALPNTVTSDSAWWDPKRPSPGNLWKRSTDGALPEGARVVQGALRATCQLADSGVPPDPACDEPRVDDADRSVLTGSTFPIGATVLTCSAKDAFGNEATASFTVCVRDTTPPEITVPEAVVATAPTGSGTVKVGFSVSAVDAVAGEVTPDCDPPAGSDFPIGVTSVECSATDERNPPATASFNVVVTGPGDPVPVLPSVTVPGDMVVEATGGAGAEVDFAGAVSAQSGDGTTLTPLCEPASPHTFALGNHQVSCSATDSVATVTKSFAVRVQDTTPPAITVPAEDLLVDADPLDDISSGQVVDFEVTAADTVDDTVIPNCSPATGSVFARGTTRVTCRASDDAGNSAEASFNVVVQDNGPPELLLVDDDGTEDGRLTVAASDLTGALVEFNVSAEDPEGGSIVDLSCVLPSGSWFPLGETSVTCTAIDDRENVGQTSFVVEVVDKSPPLLTLPPSAPIVVEAVDAGGSAVSFEVSASDNVDVGVAPECVRVNPIGLDEAVVSGATFPIGRWQVLCTATDVADNSVSGTFTVEVRDTTDPVLQLPDDLDVLAPTQAGAEVGYVARAVDTVSGTLPAACTPAPGTLFGGGDTTVNCVARDQAGNEATGSFHVTVTLPNRPPVLELPDEVVAEATSIDGAQVFYDFEVSATDPEDGALTPDCKPISGSQFSMGATTVACTVFDSGGLSDSDEFTVRVVDSQGPVFSNVPGVVNAFATSSAGAAVSYPIPTATDVVDGPVDVECTPVPGSLFEPGETTVTCTARDRTENETEVTFPVWVTFDAPTDTSFFRPPFAGDGSVFQSNQTIQVTFRLQGASADIADLVATFSATRLTGAGAPVLVAEGTFGRQGVNYRYTWRPNGLPEGTYLISVDLGDGVPHEITVILE